MERIGDCREGCNIIHREGTHDRAREEKSAASESVDKEQKCDGSCDTFHDSVNPSRQQFDGLTLKSVYEQNEGRHKLNYRSVEAKSGKERDREVIHSVDSRAVLENHQ